MAGARQTVVLLVATMATVLFGMSSAATFTVGGNTGWTIPSTTSFYSNWVSQQTFQVGDDLVFNFTTGQHTVAPVAKAAYDACSTSNLLSPAVTTSPARINLTTAGSHYFICTIPAHCSAGQKLAVVVTGPSSTPAPQPSPRRTPTPTPSPPPAPRPTTSRPSAPPTTSPAAAPTPSSSTASPPQPVARAPAPSSPKTPAPSNPTTPAPSSPTTPAPSTPADGSGAAQPPAGNFAAPTATGVSLLSLASVAAVALLF